MKLLFVLCISALMSICQAVETVDIRGCTLAIAAPSHPTEVKNNYIVTVILFNQSHDGYKFAADPEAFEMEYILPNGKVSGFRREGSGDNGLSRQLEIKSSISYVYLLDLPEVDLGRVVKFRISLACSKDEREGVKKVYFDIPVTFDGRPMSSVKGTVIE